MGDMKNKIQMVDDDQVENVGIMSGFMDDLEGLLEELSAEEMEGMEEGDEADMARTMKRSPDSPEILMNNLRGDMRSIDARREELSDLVGFREAEETPEGVLALLQPILGQQAAPMMPPQGMPAMMPPQGMPPQGMPPMMPPQGMPPQQLAAGGPVGYADGGAPVSQLMGNIARQGQQEGVGYGSNNGSLITQAMRNIAPPMGAREGMSEPPQGTPVYDPNTGALIGMSYANDNLPAGFPTPPPQGTPVYDPEAMPISPDDAAIRDLLLQQGRQVAPPVAGPATGGIGSLAPPVAPVNGINDEGIMRRMQEEQQRRMMEEQQRRMVEEQQRRMMEERMPMPPYDPRTGGIGTPIDDLPQLPPTDIGYDPRPPMDDRMPMPSVMPVGTPVDQRPMFAPQRMPAFSPPPDSGVGALFAPQQAPRFMADGGMVQHFQDGSDAAGVTPSGTYSPEIIAEAVRRMQERMGQQPEAVPTLKAGMDEAMPMYQELLGSDPSNTQAQMLFDIGQAALGYAGNVGPDGQPLRGSAAARLAGATRELPGRIGARAAGIAKEEQALRMAALQAAQGERSAAQARNAALYDQQSELYKDIATREPAARMLTPEETSAMGLDSTAGAWGVDGKGKPFLAGGRTPAGTNISMGTNKLGAEVGKLAGAQLDASYNAANGALSTKNSIALIRPTLEAEDAVFAGPLSGARLYVNRLGSVLGVEGATDQERLNNTVNAMRTLAQFELQAAEAMRGQGQITENERALIRRTAAGELDKMTQEEVVTLLNALDKTADYKINQHNSRLEHFKSVYSDDEDTMRNLNLFELTEVPLFSPTTDVRAAASAIIRGN